MKCSFWCRPRHARCALLMLLAGTTLGAQEPHRHTGRNGFLREVGAGAFGSFVGMIPVMFVPSCFEHTHYNENIDCREPVTLAAFVASPVGTALGVSMAARHNGSSRHAIGAWLGGVAGGAAGIALANALDRSGAGPIVTFPVYYVTQATLSTLGSRAVGRLRRLKI